MTQVDEPRDYTFLIAVALLSLVPPACGFSPASDSLVADEHTARRANVSVLAVSPQGGGATPSFCDPNSAVGRTSEAQAGDVTYCDPGRVQTISNDGNVTLYRGCFTHYSTDLNEMLLLQCGSLHASMYSLSPNDWLATKQYILGANPLMIKTSSCYESGVQCVSDFATLSLTVSVDGNTHTFSWPNFANGLPANLTSLIDALTRIGFY